MSATLFSNCARYECNACFRLGLIWVQHPKFLFDVLSGTDKISALNSGLKFFGCCTHKCIKMDQTLHSYRAQFEKSVALISSSIWNKRCTHIELDLEPMLHSYRAPPYKLQPGTSGSSVKLSTYSRDLTKKCKISVYRRDLTKKCEIKNVKFCAAPGVRLNKKMWNLGYFFCVISAGNPGVIFVTSLYLCSEIIT